MLIGHIQCLLCLSLTPCDCRTRLANEQLRADLNRIKLKHVQSDLRRLQLL